MCGIRLVGLVLSFASSSILSAKDWGLQYSAGSVALHGDLGGDSSRLFHDFQIKTPSLVYASGSVEAYLSIDVLMFRALNSKERFSFPKEDLRFLNFLFVANVCPMADQKIDFCLGLGQGTVNVNATGERRDYGSWNYQALIRYRLGPQWSAQILTKYVGKVEQSVAGQNSSFSFSAIGAGLSKRF